MNTSKIDQLLSEYWEGETTVAEERMLSEYFHSDEVHPSHAQLVPLFSFYKKEQETLACNLDLDTIDFEKGDPPRKGYGHFNMSPWMMGIAASVLILFTITFGLNIPDSDTQGQFAQSIIYDEDAEMQEAYEVTKEALALLSKKLNRGQKTVAKNLNEFKKVDIIN